MGIQGFPNFRLTVDPVGKVTTNRMLLSFSSLDEVQLRVDLLSQNGCDQAGLAACVYCQASDFGVPNGRNPS